MSIDIVCQVMIVLFGVPAMWLICGTGRWKGLGYLLGLMGQPAWFYTVITHEQWGMLLLVIFYTISWIRGVHNYYIKTPL